MKKKQPKSVKRSSQKRKSKHRSTAYFGGGGGGSSGFFRSSGIMRRLPRGPKYTPLEAYLNSEIATAIIFNRNPEINYEQPNSLTVGRGVKYYLDKIPENPAEILQLIGAKNHTTYFRPTYILVNRI